MWKTRKNFPRRRTVVKGLDDLWQMDLGQLDRYAKINRNFKYILTVIDCFSKYVWAVPLKTKTVDEVTRAFESVLKGSGKNQTTYKLVKVKISLTTNSRNYYKNMELTTIILISV